MILNNEDLVRWGKDTEAKWASLSGFGRAKILRGLGHHELCAMTATDMTLLQITVRFGERLSEAITGQL